MVQAPSWRRVTSALFVGSDPPLSSHTPSAAPWTVAHTKCCQPKSLRQRADTHRRSHACDRACGNSSWSPLAVLPPLLLLLLLALLQSCSGASTLQPELDLRQLQEAIAAGGFTDSSLVSHPARSRSASRTISTTTTTSSTGTSSTPPTNTNTNPSANASSLIALYTARAGEPHPGSQYELPASPAELTDCLNSHQPDTDGTSWTSAMRDEHSHFKVVGMWWSRKTADVPLTITTQLSWNRKWQLKAMCRSWGGPIAAVMHMPLPLPRLTGRKKGGALADVPPATLQRAVDIVAAFHARMDRQQPCKLDLMLLAEPYKDGKSLVLYPVNTMRNYARLMARTPLIGLVDVDLIVSSSLRHDLRNATAAAAYIAQAEAAVAAAAAGRRGPAYSTGWSRRSGVGELADSMNVTMTLTGPRTAYVLPAFATRGGSLAAQVELAEQLVKVTKDQLLPYYMKARILRFDWGSTGHQNTNYHTWFNSSDPYLVEWADRYEPWLFVDRLSSSWADCRFRGYGKNKIIHIRTLAYEGYELRVHPQAFLIHRAHVQSSSSSVHLRATLYGQTSKRSTMYGHNLHLYEKVQRAMALGKYIPEVDPATAACRKKLSWWAGVPPE